jgi:ubiquinone/menaquinone biosynthesis C-methylase UbiE
MKKCEVQVSKEHYYGEYDSYYRQLSYLTQYNLVQSLNPKSILEIGIGNSFLNNLLKINGFHVNSADLDIRLNPDIVCDIRSIPVGDEAYDVVVAFEVLEHLTYTESLKALTELKRIAKKNVIISIPYSCLYFEIVINIGLPYLDKQMSIPLRIPNFLISGKSGNPEHHWELGRKKYSKNRFLNDLRRLEFQVDLSFHVMGNRKHFFIVLSK